MNEKPDLEQRAEQLGRDLEKKAEALEKRLPAPTAALLDAICLGAVLLAGAWLLTKLGWLAMITWRMVGIGFALIYVVSLAYRLGRRAPKA
mgnify:CR=1 FL=1